MLISSEHKRLLRLMRMLQLEAIIACYHDSLNMLGFLITEVISMLTTSINVLVLCLYYWFVLVHCKC